VQVEPHDWAVFDFSYVLDLPSLIPHMVAVEEYKAAALNPVLPPHWLEAPEDPAAGGDGAIGNTPAWGVYSWPPAGAPQDTKIPVRKTAKARQWIKQRFVPGSAALSLPDILTLHGMVAEEHGVTGPTTGELRTDRVQVGRAEVGGVHQGAPWKRLPDLMAQYVDFVDGADVRSLPPVIQALLAHFFLDTIHPFIDGNGRSGRVLWAWQEQRAGRDPFALSFLQRWYYDSLDEGRRA